ncbi:hypothetical protein SETIT_4G094200v2 [Setaria italica]|uniref:Bifunctional inhibitor/plant lipid transfer protein/seed storage helical domain-containing protein n=1 Tax=Setaria italica TaxID=4555 RepID=A0A368QSZ0_SETIT|nr:hypothetical protein SETIT_4G094200v2 [Setaria italica]
MPAKIFALLTLLALSTSVSIASNGPLFSSLHKDPRNYRAGPCLHATAISPSAVVLQQLAFLRRIQTITAVQQQQQHLLSYVFNQLAVVNPAAYQQQQQQLPFNQLAATNLAGFLQQPIIGGAWF